MLLIGRKLSGRRLAVDGDVMNGGEDERTTMPLE
jgi:hypothetical protein